MADQIKKQAEDILQQAEAMTLPPNATFKPEEDDLAKQRQEERRSILGDRVYQREIDSHEHNVELASGMSPDGMQERFEESVKVREQVVSDFEANKPPEPAPAPAESASNGGTSTGPSAAPSTGAPSGATAPSASSSGTGSAPSGGSSGGAS
jgi:hypothetical protein